MTRSRELKNLVPRPLKIVIPDLTGMIFSGAMHQAVEVGFKLAVADPTIRPEELASSGRWVVETQDPAPRAERYRGDTVVVFLHHDGGGAGDREPRNPLPVRRSDRAPIPDSPSPEIVAGDRTRSSGELGDPQFR